MQSSTVGWLCRTAWAAGRKAGGLFLVLAAVASPVWADPPLRCNVPEIDPGALTSAVTLLVGGALVLADRFRR